MANYDTVLQAVNQSASAILLDSRMPKRYTGEYESIDKKASHIPEAINVLWINAIFESGSFKDEAELRKYFQALLGSEDKTRRNVIVYCGSGINACGNLLAMELAGFSGAKLYHGS